MVIGPGPAPSPQGVGIVFHVTTRLIVDCDTGIDDAVTLLYLAGRPDVELVAVGAVHGNVPVATGARNTLRVLEVAGLADVPVAVGAPRPMAQDLLTAEFIHGDDGLGNSNQPAPQGKLAEESAVEQLVRLARANPGELTLLAIGPMTNLGVALLVEPELPRLLKEVVIMGGAFAEPGNVGPHAEANIWHDPEAADLVFAAGWPLKVVALDVTHQTLLEAPDLARLSASDAPIPRFVSEILPFYLDGYEGRMGHRACPVHDGLAAALMLEPDLATWEDWPVTVELRGGLTRGATIIDRRPVVPPDQVVTRPPAQVAVTVDAPRAIAGLLAALLPEGE
jgi:purine nucleosidase